MKFGCACILITEDFFCKDVKKNREKKLFAWRFYARTFQIPETVKNKKAPNLGAGRVNDGT